MKFKQFLQTKGARGAIFMGIFYAIAMLGIFLPGYTAIPGNLDKLPIAIVNDDEGAYGANIAKQLQKNLPFKDIQTDVTNKQAMKDLEKNDLALVVHIPQTFSANMQKGDQPSRIDFSLNEAGATSVSSSMRSIVKEINQQFSKEFSQQKAQGILMKFNVPEKQAAALADKIGTAYEGNIITINKLPAGMNHNMLPMFLTMAVYVGAMIGSMQLAGSLRASRGKASKTKLFLYVQATALIIAVVSALIAVGVTYLVNSPDGSMFFKLVGQQILNYMVCFNFTAILVLLFGEGGMILNLPILLAQTLANGSVIPRQMMPAPYEWLSHISPMYYSVQAYYANLYSTISAGPFIWLLAAVGAVALLINLAIVAFVHKPVPILAETTANGEISA